LVKQIKELHDLVTLRAALRDQYGMEIIRSEDLQLLVNFQQSKSNLLFLLKSLKDTETAAVIKSMDHSKSQLWQDLFVLTELQFKKNGYFVEFGACDGLEFSNTYLLENRFSWNGILAEPAYVWREQLLANRTAHISFNCVSDSTGAAVDFIEASDAKISTIASFAKKNNHLEVRKNGKKYTVETVSLVDLLKHYEAPHHIDYLSIDTEGNELEILENFNFEEYSFSVITCEHNYSGNREKIFNLLSSKGYKRKFENISKFDDWYVKLSK
jgi:FkbM family methyltransferase